LKEASANVFVGDRKGNFPEGRRFLRPNKKIDGAKRHHNFRHFVIIVHFSSFSDSTGVSTADVNKKSTTNKLLTNIVRLIMNHHKIKEHLRVNGQVFKYLFQSVTDEQACWKPGKDRWSILEAINHLYDEEREDFRQRLELVLSNPKAPWPPIDPEGWVVERKYNESNLKQSLDNFFEEREKSLLWLNGLAVPNWQATHQHPQMGPMSAELILANWLAHDLFHIRQVNDLQFAYLKKLVKPVSMDYSGWD